MSASLLCMLRLSERLRVMRPLRAGSPRTAGRSHGRRGSSSTPSIRCRRGETSDLASKHAAAPSGESGRIASLRDARAGRSSPQRRGRHRSRPDATPQQSARAARVGHSRACALRCPRVLRCRRAAVVLADSVAARLALALAGAASQARAHGRRARVSAVCSPTDAARAQAHTDSLGRRGGSAGARRDAAQQQSVHALGPASPLGVRHRSSSRSERSRSPPPCCPLRRRREGRRVSLSHTPHAPAPLSLHPPTPTPHPSLSQPTSSPQHLLRRRSALHASRSCFSLHHAPRRSSLVAPALILCSPTRPLLDLLAAPQHSTHLTQPARLYYSC